MIIETTTLSRPFLGKDINLRVGYIFHEGFTENKTDPAEPASVKITSVATKDFSPSWMASKQYMELEVSKEVLNELEEELLGEK